LKKKIIEEFNTVNLSEIPLPASPAPHIADDLGENSKSMTVSLPIQPPLPPALQPQILPAAQVQNLAPNQSCSANESNNVMKNRNVELIKKEAFKLIKAELNDIMRKDLLKKLIEQFSFKLIDDWEKQAPTQTTSITPNKLGLVSIII
jgi:hypothetical protein